jgi:UDP-glucose 4-epimerase
MSVLELAKAVSNNYIFLEKRLGEAKETLGDITKIQKTIDWKPEIDIINWTKDAKIKIDTSMEVK